MSQGQLGRGFAREWTSNIVMDLTNISKNYDGWSVFIGWECTLEHIFAIEQELRSSYELVHSLPMLWSDTRLHDNADRFYGAPIPFAIDNTAHKSDHVNKIGCGRFHVFLVHDDQPDFGYEISVSGHVLFCNRRFVRTKRTLRGMFSRRYAVHCSANREEFITQCVLLFGVEFFKILLQRKSPSLFVKPFSRDLVGANGWQNYTDLFSVLQHTTRYAVLRGFEGLPEANNEHDLDLITDSPQNLAAIINLRCVKWVGASLKGVIRVNQFDVAVDIRCPHDGYYDPVWAVRMLDRRDRVNIVHKLCSHDHFFSLLYHCAVHKRSPPQKHLSRLLDASHVIKAEWFSESIFKNQDQLFAVVEGFLIANGYRFTMVTDKYVQLSPRALRRLASCSKGNHRSIALLTSILIRLKKKIRFLARAILK